MPKTEKDWNRFRVGRPSTRSNWTETDCVPFNYVSHYTHLESSFTSLREGVLRATLVYDESKLNTERIRVVWFSPNNWENAGGFRYGSVGFDFKWQELIKDLNSYWIESIAYGTPACRILLTANNYDSLFDRYDATVGNGPWWFDRSTGEHYRNGDYCLEIMFEDDLELIRNEGVTISSHHGRYCSLNRYNPNACPDLGLDRQVARGYFLARIVGTKMNTIVLKFTEKDTEGKIIPKWSLEFGFNELLWKLPADVNFCGTLRSTDSSAESLVRAICSAYSYRHFDEQKKLASLFVSKEELWSCCRNVVAKDFGLSDSLSLRIR